jgi:hypothetical protein
MLCPVQRTEATELEDDDSRKEAKESAEDEKAERLLAGFIGPQAEFEQLVDASERHNCLLFVRLQPRDGSGGLVS